MVGWQLGVTHMNQKGQGLTEYGIILLLVLLIGTGVWFNSGLGDQDKSIFSTIYTKLQSIIDDVTDQVAKTFDLKDPQKQANRGSTSYKTALSFTFNGVKYDILWRYEGLSGGKPGADTRKVYSIVRDSDANKNYTGTDGLMTSPDLNDKPEKIKNATLIAEYANINGRDYSSEGYTNDSDGSKTTYFNLDGATYQIKDYGTGSDYDSTMLSTYTGNVNAPITAVVNGAETTTTVAALAASRTALINGQITDSTVTGLKKY